MTPTGRTSNRNRNTALIPAIGCIRVSDVGGREGDSFRSPDQQRRRITADAKSHGCRIVDWIEELDVSGRTTTADGSRFDRAGFAAAEQRVIDGEVRALIFYDLKRFGRNTAAMLATRKRLRAAGGELIIGDMPIDDGSPIADAVFTMLSTFSTLEGDLVAERFEQSKHDAWTDGIYLSTRHPFGYRFDERRHLVVDELEGAIVLELFEGRARGASWTELVEVFEQHTGRSISRQSLRDLIQRRAYVGESPIAGGWKRSPNGHDAIVDEQLFDAAQRPSERWKRTTTRERFDGRAKSLLTGIARCGTCGSKMHRTNAGSASSLFYRCHSRSCTARVSVKCELLDAYVERELLAWAEPVLDEPVELDELAEPLLEQHRRELELELRDAELGLDAWIEGTASTALTVAQVQRGIDARTERVAVARLELVDFDSANVATATRVDAVATIRGTWGELAELERRELIASVVDAVVVDRGRVVNARRARLQPVEELVTIRYASLQDAPERDQQTSADVVAPRV